MTPYEEVYDVIQRMLTLKETLETTDADYFGKGQLEKLTKTCNELSKTVTEVSKYFEEE